MLIPKHHSWNLNHEEAREIQEKYRHNLVHKIPDKKIRTIAGCDIALDDKRNRGLAAVILFSFPELEELERVSGEASLLFPYIPGLLSFREAPALLDAFAKLKKTPDIIMFDGQGIAHPRRFGLAAHLSLILKVPGIGCAKSRLIGEYSEPKAKKGSETLLTHEGETIGKVLRTRNNVKPVFISPGHLMDLKAAVQITLACTDDLRIPKPTRMADKFAAQLKKTS